MPPSAPFAAARARTPGAAAVTHLDSAGSSLPPRAVTEAVVEHLQLEARVGGYRAAELAAERHDRVYDRLAALIGCGPDEIALADSSTRAWQLAALSVPLRPGDRVITSRAEYASNVIAWIQLAERRGVEVVAVPSAADGAIDLDALRGALDERARLVSLTHVNSNDGMINHAREVGRIARAAGVPFLLDACQSVGQMPVSVDDLGCDLLAAAGRKFLRGPRGTGFLYVRRALLDRLDLPVLDLVGARVDRGRVIPREGARRYEGFERSVALGLGLAAAVEEALDVGLEAIRDHARELAGLLRAGLTALPRVRLCDRGTERSALVTFVVEGHDCDALRLRLAARDVIVSTVGRHAPLAGPGPELSRVLRASPHAYNDEADVDRFLAVLAGEIR